MKALSLPINALVIIVLCVAVLVSIIALFYTGTIIPREVVNAQTALNDACLKLQNYNCQATTDTIEVDNFDADKDGFSGAADTGAGWIWGASTCNHANGPEGDCLTSLCACYYQINGPTAEGDCKKLCHC